MGTGTVLRSLAVLAAFVSAGCVHAQPPGGSVITVTPMADASATGELRFREKLANGVNYVGYKAPASIAANKIWELPGVDGIGAQCSDGSLVLSYGLCAFLTTSSSPSLGLRIYGSENKELVTIDRFGGSTYPGVYTTRSNGTVASPTAVLSQDVLGIYAFGGSDGSTIQRAQARITALASANWTGSSTPTELNLWTTLTGSTTPVVRWKLLESGDLIPNGSNLYRIGYLTSRVSEFYNVAQDISGTLTFRAANSDLATLAASNGVGGGSANLTFVGTSLRPSSSGGANLGSTTLPWATGWINQLVSTTACTGCVSIVTTSPITGGTITGSGTIACPTCIVDNGSQTIAGNKTFSNTTTFNGLTQLGSGANLRPVVDGASNLGATGTHFGTGWINSLVFTQTTVNGNAGVTSTTCSSFDNGICIAP